MDPQRKKIETRILNESSSDAQKVAKDLVGKIALIVTSPPYHNAISYTSHAVDPKVDYRTRSQSSYSLDYWPFLNQIWDSCWEMLKPGGIMAVNVGSVLESGYHFPLTLDVVTQLTKDAKWDYVSTVLWHKVTAGVKRAGSVIQHPYPGYWYSNIMTEHIVIVSKPGPRSEVNSDVPPEWLEPVWDLAPVPPRSVAHPAPYPEDLPHRLILLFTQPDDWVMDPFNGAGATTKASFDLSRNSLGFDIEPQYVEVATQRLGQMTSVREKQLKMTVIEHKNFVPGKSQGKTRHGAGLASVKHNRDAE